MQNVATQDGPQKDKALRMYSQLRKNLVDTVYKSWEDTGFAWEQYNPDTGAGQRTQHFTGWTSLALPNAGNIGGGGFMLVPAAVVGRRSTSGMSFDTQGFGPRMSHAATEGKNAVIWRVLKGGSMSAMYHV